MKLPKLHCWLHGHEFPNAYGEPCIHCDAPWTGYDYKNLSLLQRMSHWWTWERPHWMRPIMRLRLYLSKCPDCGRRFHRHTQECEDLPF